jgi:hypothetical protein
VIVAIHGAGDAPAQWDRLRASLPNEELLAWAAPTALDVDYRPAERGDLAGARSRYLSTRSGCERHV